MPARIWWWRFDDTSPPTHVNENVSRLCVFCACAKVDRRCVGSGYSFCRLFLSFAGELSPSICTGCAYLIYSEVYQERLDKTVYGKINVAQEHIPLVTGLRLYQNPFVRSKDVYREEPLQNARVTSETAAFD